MSITGMSSLMGYTRLHVAHFRAAPFLTSVTGVLQLGQARISSSSGSTAMSRIYDTFAVLWNNSWCMKVAVLVVVCVVSVSGAEGQTLGQRASRPASASSGTEANDKVAEAYDQFLLAHHFE